MVLVAAVAKVVSYDHALAVVRAHGESGAVALLYPATIDGLDYSASMVMLDAARRGVSAPRLAWWLLALGPVAAPPALRLMAVTSTMRRCDAAYGQPQRSACLPHRQDS